MLNPFENEQEKWYSIAMELIFPFMIAGLGMVLAGLVLEHVKEFQVFKKITEIYVLVPALLGLKGNLEMTLASRLSTHANIGTMDKKSELKTLITGNIILIQLQSIVIGFLAAVVSILISWMSEGYFNHRSAIVLCTSSISTASIASSGLCLIMISVVILSHKCHINPDNIATPVAEALGDLTTLTILAVISSGIFRIVDNYEWIPIIIIGFYISLIPVWTIICSRNKYVKDVLIEGWCPIVAGMLISSMGGIILDFAVQAFHTIGVFQPCMNGVGGSLGAVQASRLSTAFHKQGKPGEVIDEAKQKTLTCCPNPYKVFCSKSESSCTVRVLLSMAVPGHLTFMFLIWQWASDNIQFSVLFIVLYILAALIQVAILLFIAQWLVSFIWFLGLDPDNVCIPYVTSLGDLIGIILLTVVFTLCS